MSFSTNLRDFRQEAGLTQEQLAEIVGVTASAIANYENNVSMPRKEILQKLMQALGCDANSLLMEREKEESLSEEDQLRREICKKYGSIADLANDIGIPGSTIYSILQRGISNAGVGIVTKIFGAVGFDVKSIGTGNLRPESFGSAPIGEKISMYRKVAGLTIDELAEKSGVPKSTINKIIAGISKSPTWSNVAAISQALGRNLYDFCDFATPESGDILTDEEKLYIKKIRSLDAHGKAVVDAILSLEAYRMSSTTQQETDGAE